MAREIIQIGTVPNDGTGDTLRDSFDKSNDNFSELYSVSGWGYYVDSLTTPTITANTSFTQITIDGTGATNEDYLPRQIRGTGHLWATNKITPISIGDDYDGRLDLTFTAKSGSPEVIEVIIEISGGTAGTNVVFTGYIHTAPVPYRQSVYLDFFSLTTFITNGGKIYIRTDTGTVTVGDRAIKITRKGRGSI
jgi:ribosomal protein S18